MLPLFFQVVLLDSATTAGARLAIPSLATPIGGLISGIVMSRWGKLATLVRTGCILMVVGNTLVSSLGFVDSRWKYFVYIFPANVGQGIVYPGILFTSLATFEHAGTSCTLSHHCRPQCISALLTTKVRLTRPRSDGLYHLPYPVPRRRLGRFDHFCHCAKYAQCPASGRLERGTR